MREWHDEITEALSAQDQKDIGKVKSSFFYRSALMPFTLAYGCGVVGSIVFGVLLALTLSAVHFSAISVIAPLGIALAFGYVAGTVGFALKERKKRKILDRVKQKLMLRRAYVLGVHDAITQAHDESFSEIVEMKHRIDGEIHKLEEFA